MSTRDKFVVLIGIIVVFVVGAAATFLLSRSAPSVSTIFGKIDRPDVPSAVRLQSKLLTIDFKSGEKAPETANVFKIAKREITKAEAGTMASKFGFTTQGRGGFTLTWKQKGKSLHIDLDNGSLDFKNQNIKPLKGKYSVKKLAATAMKVLKQKGLPTDGLIADTENTRLFEVEGPEFQAVSKSTKAVFIEIGFNRKLNEYNLFYPVPSDPPVSVMLNNKGHIFRVFYKFTNINETTSGTYPLIDIEALTSAKLAIFGTLVSPQLGDDIFEPKLIKSITLEDFVLAYLDDQMGEYVEPIYILRGFATVGTETTEVVIYYPALEEGWLK